MGYHITLSLEYIFAVNVKCSQPICDGLAKQDWVVLSDIDIYMACIYNRPALQSFSVFLSSIC